MHLHTFERLEGANLWTCAAAWCSVGWSDGHMPDGPSKLTRGANPLGFVKVIGPDDPGYIPPTDDLHTRAAREEELKNRRAEEMMAEMRRRQAEQRRERMREQGRQTRPNPFFVQDEPSVFMPTYSMKVNFEDSGSIWDRIQRSVFKRRDED